ncbi:MAG: DUF5615 family PIN-like protein [Thermomicrobiales bacterium]
MARWLADQGLEAEHVVDRQMETADDREIWEYAIEVEAVIVTKDEDFANRRTLAAQGPQIVWIRRGNTTRAALLSWFEPLLLDVLNAIERGELVIEIV